MLPEFRKQVSYCEAVTDLHLMVMAVEDGRATLRDKSGATFEVPDEWLPSAAVEGASVTLDLSPGDVEAQISVRVVRGTVEPEGTDIGA